MGTITCSRGAYRAFWSDQGLVNTGVSKTVRNGMEEVVGSIPTRSTNKLNNLAHRQEKRDTLSIRWFSRCIFSSVFRDFPRTIQ